MVMKEPRATVRIVFGQQWSSLAQRKTIYQAVDTHTIHCWFWFFQGIFWQKNKYRIKPALSFNSANLCSKELRLWLHPIRLNSTNEIFSACGAALHRLMFVKPKTQFSIREEATVQTTDRAELLSDGDMMKHRATLTHTLHSLMLREQCRPTVQYLWKTRRKQLTLTRVQWFENNAIIRSLWIDPRHTRMRKWGLAGRLWHCLGMPHGKMVFGTRSNPTTNMLCTQILIRHIRCFEEDNKLVKRM